MVTPRMTLQVQRVLRALLADPDVELYGLEIVDRTGLPPGTIYPIMARLEEAGWVTSRWEQIDQHEQGRPRRRYYRLAGDGQLDGAGRARLALADVDARQRARRRRTTAPAATDALPGGAA